MAHGFKNLGKNTTFASKREIAWHGLGSVVDSMTSKEAIILGGLDFEVGLASLYVKLEETELKNTHALNNCIRLEKGVDAKFFNTKGINSNFATYRTDNNTIFGIVGNRYEVIQNTEAFEFFDSIIGEGHARYETVGALGNGETVFITAKLPGNLNVNKEDIDKYLLLTMSHDGSSSIQAMFTPIRVVCNNTLTLALKSRNKVTIRHTKNARERLEKAKEILGIVQTETKNMEEVFNIYAKTKVNDEDAFEIFKKSFGIIPQKDGKLSTRSFNKLEEIKKIYFEGVGQKEIIGSAWGVYNGVTTYLQNYQNIKGDEDLFKKSFMGKDEEIKIRTLKNINILI